MKRCTVDRCDVIKTSPLIPLIPLMHTTYVARVARELFGA
jgi:hypothetical protein